MARNFSDRTDSRHRDVHRCASALLFLSLGLMSALAPRLVAQAASARAHRKVLVSYQPVYPFVLQNGHFEGQVRLAATVLPNGSVSKVETKGGNPMLAQYAVEAVNKWKYAPGPATTLEEVSFYFNSNK
jgi:TonB family protein